MPTLELSLEEKNEIVEALLACPTFMDMSTRGTLLQQLPPEIVSSIPRGATTRIEAVRIVSQSLDYPRGLKNLVAVLKLVEGTSPQVMALERLVDELAFVPTIISKAQLKALQEIVEPVQWPTNLLRQVFRASAPNSRFSLEATDEAVNLSHMLRLLSNALERPVGMFPILDFVERLAAQMPELRTDLRNWVDETASHLGVEPTAVQSLRESAATSNASIQASQPYLLVKIEPNDSEQNLFILDGWLWKDWDNVIRLPIKNNQTLLEDLPKVLEKWLGIIFQELQGETGNLSIEFFLPRQLICHNINEWEMRDGINKRILLGAKYPVVVRSLERVSVEFVHYLWPYWTQKWKQFQTQSYLVQETVLWINADQVNDLQELGKKLEVPNVLCLVLLCVPTEVPGHDQSDVFTALLDAGLPIALWPRQTSDDPCLAEDECKLLFSGDQIAQLPMLLWEKRKNMSEHRRDLWHHMTLLWDDPSRVPPELDFRRRLEGPTRARND